LRDAPGAQDDVAGVGVYVRGSFEQDECFHDARLERQVDREPKQQERAITRP
jgi:hypothetical protein